MAQPVERHSNLLVRARAHSEATHVPVSSVGPRLRQTTVKRPYLPASSQEPTANLDGNRGIPDRFWR